MAEGMFNIGVPTFPIDTGLPSSVPTTPPSEPVQETQEPEEGVQTFTFVRGTETGEQAATTSFYGQTTEPEQVTAEELRAYFESDDCVILNQAFGGDFDKYMSYMIEREQAIQSGE